MATNTDINNLLDAMKIGRRISSASADTLLKIKALVDDLMKEEEVEGETPTAGKSLNLAYAKSMGLLIPDAEMQAALACKSIGKDEIRSYTFIWGHPDKRDVEREYFDRQTNFWDAALKDYKRPLTWDHAQDDSLKASPIIGQITDFGDDEVGRWYTAHLDRSHRYRKAVDALIEQGVLGSSSDTALQYTKRVPQGKSTYIAEWPWFATALTDTPAEPRTIKSTEYFKSIGFDFPFPEATVEQLRRQVERAQRDVETLKLIQFTWSK